MSHWKLSFKDATTQTQMTQEPKDTSRDTRIHRNYAGALRAQAQVSVDELSLGPSTSHNVRPSEAKPKVAPKPVTSKLKYPSLVAESFPNWAHHFTVLKAKLGRPPSGHAYQKGFRFTPSSENEYRTIQRYLTMLEREEKISWFSYSLPAEGSLKLDISGIPSNTTTYRKCNKGSAQCLCCSQFKNLSYHCHRPLACVHCGVMHLAENCQSREMDEPTCAYRGSNPANHTACLLYKGEVKSRRASARAFSAEARKKVMSTTMMDRVMHSSQAVSVASSSMITPGNVSHAQGLSIGIKKHRKKKSITSMAFSPVDKSQEAAECAPQKVTSDPKSTQNLDLRSAQWQEQRRGKNIRFRSRRNTECPLERSDPMPVVLQGMAHLSIQSD